MKKLSLILALCALTLTANAKTYNYLCAITEITVDTLKHSTKNQFTLNWTQKCKNIAEYDSNPNGTYTTTVKLVLNSDDRTLEGTYSTEGASPTSNSANVNDQTICLVSSELYYGTTRRLLRTDSISTFTIVKVDDTHYGISIGRLCFTAAALQDRNKNTYNYNYCYAEDEILNKGIEPKPFVFGYDGLYHQQVYNYDITVNSINVIRDDTDYGATRYLLTLNASGINTDDNSQRSYEMQLAIYPTAQSIVGTFATQGASNLLYASNCYVKDLKINKQRYLANDSLSSVQIKSTGTNQYAFYGGTLICTDVDLNYQAVYGLKRVEAVHYYHFLDNGGQGVPFGFDEDNKNVVLTPSKVTVTPATAGGEITHYDLLIDAKNENNVAHEVSLTINSTNLVGTFSYANEQLSAWSSVNYGTTYSYIASGASTTITNKAANTYTLNANLLCENGYTYIINNYDFNYGTTTVDTTTTDTTTVVTPSIPNYTLTADKVTVEDVTVDKNNFFVTVKAHTSTGEYEVAFDIWPQAHSAIGSFSAANGSISYVSSYVHKTKANGSAVDMWYYAQDKSLITLSITKKDDTTCTLSGSIQAERNGATYQYNIPAFDFAYSETDTPVVPDPDPYRFEPAQATTVNFLADVINFRQRTNYIEVTLNEMANETYNWIELRLLSDTMAMPAGNYTINNSAAPQSLTASKGYLGATNGDDPCYVAIRAELDNWGQYTPYYLESGTLTVSYNTLGDSITISGTAYSHNGSTIQIYAKSYNMLYVPEEQKTEPEFVTLAIDTVLITYQSDLSDSTRNEHYYTFNFFSSQGDYPNVLVDVILNKPMALTQGLYTLADGQLKGLNLFQNQADFNAVFFGGEPYVFDRAELQLTPANGNQWRYQMFISDTIGSEYTFDFAQDPHIVFYPVPVDTTDAKDKPYADEQKQIATITVVLDTLVWDSKTVAIDGILDIHLSQLQADAQGLRAYLHLGMYSDVAYPAAGTYPVSDSEENGTFSASLGRYGNVLIPSYLALMDEDAWAHAIWFIVDGDIELSYTAENKPVLSGSCTTYFGSTINFTYVGANVTTAINHAPMTNDQTRKFIRNGQLYIMYKGTMYNVQGQVVEKVQ